jgi:hypothetical protein
MSNQLPKWVLHEISDADEPGDAAYTGIQHRDFDGVTLVLWPDDEGGWLCTDMTNQPERPLLLFFRGGDADVEDALAWLAKGGLDGPCGPSVPLPTAFDTPLDGNETIRTIPFHLNYPPYPWLEEAKLGMEMGRYFDSVELIDWVDPTETEPGSHTFRFYRGVAETVDGTPDLDIDTDDLPY